MLYCKFNVNFQNVKTPYKLNAHIEDFQATVLYVLLNPKLPTVH